MDFTVKINIDTDPARFRQGRKLDIINVQTDVDLMDDNISDVDYMQNFLQKKLESETYPVIKQGIQLEIEESYAPQIKAIEDQKKAEIETAVAVVDSLAVDTPVDIKP